MFLVNSLYNTVATRTLSVVVKSTIDTRINHYIICYSPVITELLSGSTTTEQTAIACYFLVGLIGSVKSFLCKSCHAKKNCSHLLKSALSLERRNYSDRKTVIRA